MFSMLNTARQRQVCLVFCATTTPVEHHYNTTRARRTENMHVVDAPKIVSCHRQHQCSCVCDWLVFKCTFIRHSLASFFFFYTESPDLGAVCHHYQGSRQTTQRLWVDRLSYVDHRNYGQCSGRTSCRTRFRFDGNYPNSTAAVPIPCFGVISHNFVSFSDTRRLQKIQAGPEPESRFCIACRQRCSGEKIINNMPDVSLNLCRTIYKQKSSKLTNYLLTIISPSFPFLLFLVTYHGFDHRSNSYNTIHIPNI